MKSTRTLGRFAAGLAIVGGLTVGTVGIASGTASAATGHSAPRTSVSGVHIGTAVAYTRSANGTVHRVR